MKIKFAKGYILIISPTIMNINGFLSGVGNRAKGAAFFPFLFVRSEEFLLPWVVNHELIHFRQQIETLFIGNFIITQIERLYARFILKKTNYDSNLWSSAEQEAYINQNNFEYLKTRRFFAQFFYLKNKKKITLPAFGEVIIEE